MNIFIVSITLCVFIAHVSARGYGPGSPVTFGGGLATGMSNIGAGAGGISGVPERQVPGAVGLGTGAGGLGTGSGGFGVAPGGLGAGTRGLGAGASGYRISGLGAAARGSGASSVSGVSGTGRISGPMSSYGPGIGGISGVSAPGYNTTPKPFAYEYQSVDEQGNVQFKQEKSDNSGSIQGKYGYMDSQGLYREVKYTANEEGFKAVVQTNEPGTDGKESPADVQMNVEQPPAGVQPQYGAGGSGELDAGQVGVAGNVGGRGDYGPAMSGGYGGVANIGGPIGAAPAMSGMYGGVSNIGGLGGFNSAQGGNIGLPSGGYGGGMTVGVYGAMASLGGSGTSSSLSGAPGSGGLLGGVPEGAIVLSGGVPPGSGILNSGGVGGYEKSMGSFPGFGGLGGSTVGLGAGQGVRSGKSGY